MPARRNPTPSYLLHKQSGRARAVWTDATGIRHQKLLPGEYDSPESRTAFARLQLELATSPSVTVTDLDSITVAEVLAAHIDYAEQHYCRPDGTQTHEVVEYKLVYRLLRELYGNSVASEFGPLALKAVRSAMLEKHWCRSLVNQRIGRVRRIFKWAAGEELIPFAAYHALTAVTGLQRGRTAARETEPVGPVDDATVDATLPHLNRYVRGLVEFQRLTGCRPGEACLLRRCDIDTGGKVWLYRPAHHKLAYKNKPRVVAIGPKAQEVVKEFFVPDINAYLFSPCRAVEELHAERCAKRKTPRYPSHMERNATKRVKHPGRKPANKYNVGSYGHAIARACEHAFPPPEPLAKRHDETLAEWDARLCEKQRKELAAWRKAHRWHPNQLRHSFGTRVRKQHGLEAAQVLLGHARADVTQVYAERNEELAATVAAKIG